nr:ribonuclease H-like domain-containing protein [Tanacetum cinerariifolium]
MNQTFEKSSLVMTRKLDDMIELPKSQPKRTYEDLECEMVMVKIPRYMQWLYAYDEPRDNANVERDRSSDLTFSFCDPLYVYPNDTSGAPTISLKLTESENYNMWSCAMKFALRNKSNLGFIDVVSGEESHKNITVSRSHQSKPGANAFASKDSKKGKIVGTGKQSNGLYLFYVDHACK